ncbi:ureidoglycolate lyase [Xanthobacter sp. KR7-225]|uniref:ureidoglycolate lyase n=1 Tax=Xanthobacter sp. KR7-225 TaxID=3156613 RepID=UPI0032B453D1
MRLSQDAFAPYGSVLRRGDPVRVNDGFATRSDALADLACSDPSARLCLSLFDVGVRPAFIVISELERHPYSAQVFLPVSPCRALVVVAGTTAEGDVDLDTMAAFIAAPGDGILYAPGVWHLGLTSLDRAGQFQMATWSGDLPDTQIRRLDRPFTIDGSASSVLAPEPDESAAR